jgi:predicted DNA-binding transcriptional regulator YafY
MGSQLRSQFQLFVIQRTEGDEVEFLAARKLLQILMSFHGGPVTSETIARRFFGTGTVSGLNETDLTDSQIRKIQRYLASLSSIKNGEQGPVQRTKDRPPKYFVHDRQVMSWFMSPEVALNLILARRWTEEIFPELSDLSDPNAITVATYIARSRETTRRFIDHVRLVSDGLGRLNAKVDPQVLDAVVRAITEERILEFDYKSRTSDRKKDQRRSVTVLGLVNKDGTKYLVARSQDDEWPRHYALQRASNALVTKKPAKPVQPFDLDRYIAESQQLSHPLHSGAPILNLDLLVSPESLFMFAERPLTEHQVITGPHGEYDGWYRVKDTLPSTLLLKYFLLMLGSGVEVLAPEDLREEIAKEATASARKYKNL